MRAWKIFFLLLLLFSPVEKGISKNLSTLYWEEKDFREFFLQEFKKNLPFLKGKTEIRRFRIEPAEIKVAKGTPFKIEWIGPPRPGSNSALLIFNPSSSQNQIVRLWGWVEVQNQVVVVKKRIPTHKVLTEEDLALENREISSLPPDVVLTLEEAIGKEVRVSLSEGAILRKSFLTPPILIKRNQEVEILARGKNFLIKAKGVALENGKLNQFIRVRNLSSNKVIQGKVIEEGKVEVPL